MRRSRSWWDKPQTELEREIQRLQRIVKSPASHSRKSVDEALRRLPSLKAILAARRGQTPMFPLSEDEAAKAK